MKLRNPLKNNGRSEAYNAMYELFLHDNFAAATKAGEKLLKQFPDDEQTFLLLGQIATVKKQRPRARERYNKALTGNMRSTPARVGRADASFEMKKREQALEDYLHLYESSRKNFPYMTKLAATYNALELPHIALKYFQKAVDMMPNNLEAHFALIEHLVKLKHYKEADASTKQLKEYYYTHKTSLPPQTLKAIKKRESRLK